MLIGADGVHSIVRRAIDARAPDARYVGLTNFGGVTRAAGGDIEPGAWHLIFGKHAFFGTQATSAGDVIWFANRAAALRSRPPSAPGTPRPRGSAS